MRHAYLDNSATTAVCPEAAQKAVELMTRCYGNPSSLHTMGIEAEKELTLARREVARLLGAEPEEIFFTSGGTEGNNLAILGGAAAKSRMGRHAVTTAVEHSSVAAAFDQLEKEGWEVTRLIPDSHGTLTASTVAAACREDTALVSVMAVNNETGARFPIEEMVPAVRRAAPQALIHTDAVQAAGKLLLKADRWGLDLLTASAHKLHGPKGCGALYVRKGVRLLPRMLGGGQEKGLRSGTEPMPAIAAFGAAAAAVPDFGEQETHYQGLRSRLLDRLRAMEDQVVFHLPEEGVPYIVNLSVPRLKSETLLHFLAERGVYVSSGSACSKGKKSPVLAALGLAPAEIDSALRISFSRYTVPEDVDQLADALQAAAGSLIRRRS